MKFYYSINGFSSKFTSTSKVLELIARIRKSGDKSIRFDSGAHIMGNVTVSLGEDEHGSYISYYDKWDLNLPTEVSGRGVGRSFEIYDRMYYDPQTGEIITSTKSLPGSTDASH